ncbi:outer membrane lipoprotein-sorting protein [Terasakiella pusilla]|jgi:hypothetical protein|uniref:outer membrane lipoprotein-sorting protein n=2 Tax=Terasakiella pusilla TaxID=64973 RepID=UPI000691F813
MIMKLVKLASLSVLLYGVGLNGISYAEDLTGREIMTTVSERHKRPYEYSVEEMRLVDASGNEEVRTLRRFAAELEDGLSKYLLTFDSPAGVKGVAMLTWERNDGDDDQWTFLPATKSLKRIVGGGKRNYFLGTDFANEDLVAENLDRFRYERQADQTIDNVDYYVIWAFPEAQATKESTGYTYREIYIRKDNFFQDIVKFFERRSKKHIKTLTVTKSSPIDGEGWRTDESVMVNFKEDHKTISKIMERSFKQEDVPEEIFKHRYITKRKHMK